MTSRIYPRVLLVIVGGIWVYLTARAFGSFAGDGYDYLMYHLFAALDAIGRTKYTPEAHIVDALRGFPPLAHQAAGALVLVTGRITSANALNCVGSIAAALILWRGMRLRLPMTWFLLIALAIPLVVIHYYSGYIDLWTNVWLLVAFGALVRLRDGPGGGALAWSVAGLAVACLSKFQAWPLAGIIAVATAARMFGLVRAGKLSRGAAVAWTLGAAVALGAWPVRNVATLGNPTYPYPPPFVPLKLHHSQETGSEEIRRLQTSHLFWDRPRWQTVLASELELSRLMAPQDEFRWTIDAGEDDGSQNGNFRLGGWSGLTVILLVATVTWAGIRRLVPPLELAVLLLIEGFLCVVPQGHELRYWLMLPLALGVLAAMALPELPRRGRMALEGAFILAAILSVAGVEPWHRRFRGPADFAPPDARAFWTNHPPLPAEGLCIVGRAPFTIFWAGPTFAEFRVVSGDWQGCDPS